MGQVLRTLRMTYDMVLYIAPKHVLAQSVGVFKPPFPLTHTQKSPRRSTLEGKFLLAYECVGVCVCESDDSVLSAPQ